MRVHENTKRKHVAGEGERTQVRDLRTLSYREGQRKVCQKQAWEGAARDTGGKLGGCGWTDGKGRERSNREGSAGQVKGWEVRSDKEWEPSWDLALRWWFGTWVGAVSEKCWQKQTAVSDTMENMSSYFKNLGCEEEERDRKKSME